MTKKIRIFIIDDKDEEKMKEDLANDELMDFYWTSTGKDMETYWIVESDYKDNFSNLPGIPNEFAMYDSQLLIEYETGRQTLFFDVLKESDWRHEIFRALEDQKRNNASGPFTKIESGQA
jgi:hypothetical protein